MARTTERTREGEQTVKEAFGGSLYGQGRGFYVTLELLAILQGTHAAGLPLFPDPSQSARYLRRSHDFARKLAVDPDLLTEEQEQKIVGSGSESTLRALLRGLVVPIPWRRTEPTFKLACLQPFVGDLIHYDAVDRRRKVCVERYNYRGAGGLVHRILREDPDSERLERSRRGFALLVGPSGSSLGRLANCLAEHDEVKPGDPPDGLFEDPTERGSEVLGSRWVELLREGCANIVGRSEGRDAIPAAKRIEALMHWVPFALAHHQLALSQAAVAADDRRALLVDCQRKSNPIRDHSQEQLNDATATIMEALEKTASARGHPELLTGGKKWATSSRMFFTSTLHACGAINATGGLRHFCLRPELLESIVHAFVIAEVGLEAFCREILYKRLNFVLDEHSAREDDWVVRIDQCHFKDNVEALSELLNELGMLRSFSDQTKMVGVNR